MTMDELDRTLPNGFHDAKLNAYHVDLVARTVRLEIELLIGTPDGATEEEREGYRPAEVRLSGVGYFITDPPQPGYPSTKPLRFDVFDADPSVVERLPTPEGGYAGQFYSATTNSFIHFAALDAQIIYPDEP